jgi:hypothetical protein
MLKAVLPRTAGPDVSGLRADGADPFLHRLGKELRAVVGTNVFGNAAQDEQVRQHVDDVDRFEPAGHPNGQALVRELVDDVEQAKFASVMGALLEEVVGPQARPTRAEVRLGALIWLSSIVYSEVNRPLSSYLAEFDRLVGSQPTTHPCRKGAQYIMHPCTRAAVPARRLNRDELTITVHLARTRHTGTAAGRRWFMFEAEILRL